ncbi:mitochondrial F1-F0 ATP synthase subunit F of fungi-domain-containing protein [Mycena olivaceomarginata]|uniref:Mitochondrial F1-F0 ATP synthase subunit F of fungi-domain-containing protein n=1 Tax=Mycena albidolilacea TaxID=1033008 RepID=A0AAD7AH84_9AGAR|nr:mitochondrial F1-F0 ATP synthase subunit F of fungi-domain-containing protein [Mycena albidolilacea]KAJ7897574.1 mitochondrial F1-F0 ATP synthase subunit F of fungi-domain-containing protein [Mycena olivaceomarginata]
MHASPLRRQLGGLVPPKIATPRLVTGNSGATLTPLVDFYSKLPKGPAPARFGGLKGRFFSGKNASGAPVLALIGGIFLIGYTLDYQLHLKHHKNNAH